MSELKPSRHLRLLKSPERRPLQEADFTMSGQSAQAVLFPTPRPGIVLFVYMSDATEKEFRDALALARPRLVVELRRTPWLDIGGMDRQQVFECFDRVRAQYVDLAFPSGSASSRETFGNRLRALLRERQTEPMEPLMFLLGSKATVEDLPQRIVSTLSAGRRALPEIHEVPSFVSAT